MLIEVLVPLIPFLLFLIIDGDEVTSLLPGLPAALRQTDFTLNKGIESFRSNNYFIGYAGPTESYNDFIAILTQNTTLPAANILYYETEKELNKAVTDYYTTDVAAGVSESYDEKDNIHTVRIRTAYPVSYFNYNPSFISDDYRDSSIGYDQFLSNGAFMLVEAVRARVLQQHGAVRFNPQDTLPTAAEVSASFTYTVASEALLPIKKSKFFSSTSSMLPFIITAVISIGFMQVLTSIVMEKETRMFELMRMMGAPVTALLGSWAIVFAITMTVTALLIALISAVSIINNVSFIVMFLVFFLSALANIAYALFISTFFSTARTAQLVGSFAYTLASAAVFGVSQTSNPHFMALVCLIPSCALSFTLKEIFARTVYVEAVTLSNIAVGNGFTVATGLGMMVVSTVVMLILSIYAQQVMPSEFGVPKPIFFPCMPRYWPCVSRSRARRGGSASGLGASLVNGDGSSSGYGNLDAEQDEDSYSVDDVVFNAPAPVHPNARVEPPVGALLGNESIKIRGLRKSFGGFVAVKKLNFDIYRGELFALLGHNGAGKTTTINMLTGLYRPSGGSARVNGYDIRTDMDLVRRSLGICPQHDVQYPNLTVRQHIDIFARLKNVPEALRERAVNDWIDRVGLGPAGDCKAEAQISTLSGGQKRRVSLAMALIGDPQLVILDEPTSGLDVAAQASVRALLQQERANRAIVLTTHSMEEAEICDRVAIMADGSLQTMGSVHYLKQTYGAGYTLTITKVSERTAAAAVHNSASHAQPGVAAEGLASPVPLGFTGSAGVTTTSGSRIDTHLRRLLPALTLLSDAAGVIVYAVPMAAVSALPPVLDSLESERAALGVEAYAVTITSLTEVFLNVANAASVNDDDSDETRAAAAAAAADTGYGSGSNNNSSSISNSVPLLGGPLGGSEGEGDDSDMWGDDYAARRLNRGVACMLFSALYKKRALASFRDGAHLRWQLMNPILMYVGILFFVQIFVFNFGSVRPLAFQDLYPAPRTVYAPVLGSETAAARDLMTGYASYLDSDGVELVRADVPAEFADVTCADPTSLNNLTQQLELRGSRALLYPAMVMACGAENVPALPSVATVSKLSLSIAVNITTPDALPATLVSMTNAVLRMGHKALGRKGPAPTLDVEVSESSFTNNRAVQAIFLTVAACFGMVMVALMVISGFAYFIVQERVNNSKHLQLISGASRITYWLSHAMWDITCSILPFFVIFICNIAFGISEMYMGTRFGIAALLYWLFVISSIPFSYMLSFLADKPARSQTFIYILNYVLCLGVMLLYALASFINMPEGVIRGLVFLVPPANLVWGLVATMIANDTSDLLSFERAGSSIIGMVASFVLYLAVLIIIETGAVSRLLARTPANIMFPTPQERAAPQDADVAAEHTAVLRGDYDNSERFPVVLRGLRKVYKTPTGAPFIAVSDLAYSISKGECFGFLGANGAGKTTAMKMVTGDVEPTSGTATVSGFDLLTNASAISQVIGYCPQFDAFTPQLSVRENLNMFARLKGVASFNVDRAVTALIRHLTLEEYANKRADTLSGGNKRKLSVGIALIGNPPIVILDEPSTGIDPQARRSMWRLISSTMANRSVILTTHLMEECEALCNRIGIMVSGGLRCLGTATHLKERFGSGFQVTITAPEEAHQDIAGFMQTTFPGVVWVSAHGQTLKFTVDQRATTLATVFRRVEENKVRLAVSSYSVNNTDLAQVFMTMVKPDIDRANATQ